MNGVKWIDYILQHPNEVHKVVIKQNDKPHIFTISLDSFEFEGQKYVTVVLNDITEVEEAQKQIETIHRHTKESIEYASLIQGAVLPSDSLFKQYFKDHFVFWQPKDIVGGDIYLFNKLRNDDECLLMVIDCTGHGVPGAFVTMLVKAIEVQLMAEILSNADMEISPAWVLGYFNKALKRLLKQETKDSISNAGFDGGIIYYNKKQQILKFAGAETPLFYVDTNGEFHTVKGNRYSVGYKKCDMDHVYKEVTISVKEGMKFYLTTDGYLDQNGGEKDFPFGKKRFGNIIKEFYKNPMNDQKEIFLYQMHEYENMIPNNDRNDDMTVIGFEIGPRSTSADILLEYDGVLTQNIISHNVDILEHTVTNINIVGKLSTIVIELTQNMMNYSKTKDPHSTDIRPAGFIQVSYKDNIYTIKTKNIISLKDKDKIEPKLREITNMSMVEIKQLYKRLRKSGENAHTKGGGIGFYEVAKLCSSIKYQFEPINQDKYYFSFIGELEQKKKIKT